MKSTPKSKPPATASALAPLRETRMGSYGALATGLPQEVKEAVHPVHSAWCWSKAFLSWVTPLMHQAHAKQLDMDDIWPLQRTHTAEHVTRRFRHDFEGHRSVPRAFSQSFGCRFVFTGIAFLIAMLCNLFGPIVLDKVVSSLTSPSFSVETVVTWVLMLFGSQVVQALVDNYANFESELIAIQFIGALKTMIYEKTMRLSAQSRMEKSTGDITNLYTSDAEYILMAAYFVHQAWLIPLQIACVSYMLFRILSWAAFAGIGVILIMLVLNNLISKQMFALQRVYRKSKDERMKKVSEVFKAIGIVKFNAWEDKFMERIDATRKIELRDLLRQRLWVSASIVLLWGMPVFISMSAFGVFSLVLQRNLTPAIVFTSISLFQLIQGPLRQVTNIITMLVQSKVALERVMAFFDMSEIKTDDILSIDHPLADSYIKQNVIVSIENATFGWDEQTPLLRDVNLQVHVGDFYVVHGTVGCGKSSLCSALLGEMVKHNGQVYVGGSIAYCSQQPWIQNMTVRDNILFGRPYDRVKYEKVIEACALTQDLKSLAAGDRTEIGERGVNVSGGQKARIALARACYSDASIYVLDSPLSAVDAIVQNEIYQKCLLGLLCHKTIILVTHNTDIIASQHITHAVTINEHGSLVETHQIQTRPAMSTPLVSPLAAHPYVRQFNYEEISDAIQTEAQDLPTFEEQEALNDEMALLSPYKEPKLKPFAAGDAEANADAKAVADGKLIVEEGRSEGRVGGHVFAAYYHAVGGLPVVVIILISQVIWQAMQISSDFYLGNWSSDSITHSNATTTDDAPISTARRMTIYSLLGIGSALMVLVRTLMVTFYGLKAAKYLFDRMTNALMHAPMRFFDVNPIGRILTRYGSDVSAVDSNIPFMFGTLAAQVFSVGCSAFTAAAVIQWKGFLLLPVVYLYYRFGVFYIQPARELQRLSKTSAAPLLNHLSESVDGGSVVRAFGTWQVARFKSTNSERLDANNKIWYAQLCVSQWFSVRIQLLGAALVLVVTASLIVLRNQLGVAVIGLAFSYALKVSQNLEKIVQVLSRVETMMVSPERMQEYITIEQEAPYKTPAFDPPASSNWPEAGAIAFDKVCFRYKEGDRLVLNNLSFSVRGGEKIGIVGRTGAGKSSLTMALFRINELASGSVIIDGLDASKLGLQVLRGKLSIIPQNPVLFKGTLRSYLDPFDEYTDDQLWACIRQVSLQDRISSDENKLACMVEENGENFSVGERQMLCMARALLRQTKIVIFDEATAAIDHETDQKLQRVIREAFAKSTVLTIAHRLDTILDADRILVLDDGKMVEFSKPQQLVDNRNGHFYELMKEGGYLESFLASQNK
ncbi:TPA: hypothetical protein N0F65_007875 [Lagenidium giganteum]|uniref:Uncharacterized protein n=1 Tax=Lagenidium giganteum TaxID=4803 RepID=A0AAV2Z1D5_9STRA|nr:TPA: hypothetical protein N0F65_007875 [Lagenidium giganteum]